MTKRIKIKMDIGEIYKALTLTIREAMQSEQIWRCLIAPNTFEKYSIQLNCYSAFFHGVEQASLTSTILNLAKFSDTHQKALGAPLLLDIMSENGIEENKIANLKKAYCTLKATWEKILILRNNSTAHISQKINENETFSRAEITPNEISTAVHVAHEILISAGNSLQESFRKRNDHENIQTDDAIKISKSILELTFDPKMAKRDTEKLLENLKAGREARLSNDNLPFG